MNGDQFSDLEKDEARKNGFILGGKTGSGKSTLLNAIIGRDMALVKKGADSVTQDTTAYFYKLKNGKMITILDTPGLMDPKYLDNPNIDNIHLREIREKISAEKIQIKGIIFLVNFQEERFDKTEQEALINYNKSFPLKNFWKNIVIIFTHYYPDPDGDSVEEMKRIKDESNRKILGKIMDKVKNVSDVIDYKDLITKYFNSYSPVKKEKQRERNEKNKEELEIILNEISNKEPLLSKIEIFTKKNYVYSENNKYYKGTLVIIGYFGLAQEPIKEEKCLKDKEEINLEEYLKLKDDNLNVNVELFRAERDERGYVNRISTNDKTESYYWKLIEKHGIKGLIGAGIGFLATLSFPGLFIGGFLGIFSSYIKSLLDK